MTASKIVTGKLYRITITGEVPPAMMAEEPELVSAAILGAVSMGMGLIATVQKVDCSLGDMRPSQPPPSH